ncbi:MAG: T9SS type A sorting domain-containing protein [Bacteroidetes bacterium]|nr:T9SS type A sorting domain-containing protein [Bacteroidota bacterium]
MKKFVAALCVLLFTSLLPLNEANGQIIDDEPLVITGKYHGLSRPLRELPQLTEEEFNALVEKGKNRLRSQSWVPKQRLYPFAETALPKDGDPIRQTEMGTVTNRPVFLNFDGQTSPYKPSDVNGDVNETHYFQTINTVYAIYNKSGQLVAGPTNLNLLFEGVTGSQYNDGDPIVLWDEAAQRWLVAEFSITGSNDYMLVAVSTSSDPSGTWHRYSFDVDDMPDYPKLGVWRDGYYMGTNTPNAGKKDIYVLERDKMLIGATAQMVGFKNNLRPNSGFHCVPPVDNDGPLAPAGSPGIFITINDDAWGGSDQIWIYELNVNWTTPASSTFARTQQINVPAFDSNFGSTWENIAQKGTTQKLDAVNQVIMHRPQYRNFGTYQTIVACHTVDVSGTDQAGIRWYELRRTGTGPWTIRQTGTYAPDNHSRWMGSIAMTPSGKIGLVYSISSTTLNPGLRFTGQSTAAYAAGNGILDVAEEVILEGTLSQTGSERWGDYFMLAIDPSDNETFWATGQYVGSGNASKTRIATFRIGNAPLVVTTAPTNITPNSATINGTVNPNTLNTTYYFEWGTTTGYGNTTTVSNAGSGSTAVAVSATLGSLTPGQTYHYRIVASNADGTTYGANQSFIPGGAELTTASVTNIGLNSAQSGGTIASDGGSPITARGVCWSTSPNPTLSGGLFTTNGTGTGSYTSSISGLNPSTTYYVRAYATNAFGTFYGDEKSFTTLCGIYAPPITQNFDAPALPNCWTTVSLNGNNQVWQVGTITGSYSPLPALTGNYAYLNSDAYGNGNSQNTDLRTPTIDLSGFSAVTLSFKHYYRHYTGSSVKVSYSINGGSTWTDLQTWTASTANPATFSQSIPAVAGQSNVMFRWNYNGNFGWYWAVDEIQITGTASNEVANFTATAVSQTQIDLSWQGANVLLVWSPTSTFGTPSNGTVYTAGQTIPGGGTVLYSGTNTTYSHTGLTPATTYYYKAFLIQAGNNYSNGVTANATTQAPAAYANVLLRPQQVDISSASAQSAVLMTVGGYASNEAKYRLFNSTSQYNVWNGSQFVTSSSYADNPLIPGTPSTQSTWWIIYQRGSNNSTSASYRDRLSPYSTNYQTVALPAATAITNPANISGSIPFAASYPLTEKYVILGYDAPSGGNLISATSSELNIGAFNLVVQQGTVIQRIEVRNVLNQLMESQTGTWPGGNPPAVFDLTGGGSYCQGASPTGISATLSGSETTATYQLLRNSIPFGDPVAGTGSPLEWLNLTEGTYTLVATNSNSSLPMNGQAVVSETPAVPVSVSIQADQTSVCQGTAVNFTATAQNPGTNPVYQWTVNGSNAGTNSPNFSFVPNDGDQVQLLLISSETCAQPAVATSNTLTITVQTPAMASIIIQASQNPVCQGSTVSFSAQLFNPGSAPIIQWFVNNILLSSGTSTSFAYMPANNDVVEAVMISSLDCVSNNPATSNGVLMEVSPLLTPSVTISTASTSLCNGQQANVSATPVNGGNSPIFQWMLNGNPAGTNSPSFSFVPAHGDQLMLSMSSSLSCVSGNPATSNTLSFTVSPVTINLGVSPAGAGTATYSGTPVIGQPLSLTATPAQGFNFLNWTDGQGNVLSSLPSFSFVPGLCSHNLTANFSSGVSLSGKLAYFNPVESALPAGSNFMVQLFDGNAPVGNAQPVATTYTFGGLEAGKTYTIRLWEDHSSGQLDQTWNFNNWGGVSALDALIVSHMSTGNPVVANFPWIMPAAGQPMTAFAEFSADVNNSNTITGLDPLIIMYRTVGFPGTSPFPGNKHNFQLAGHWAANAASVCYPAAPETLLTPNGAYQASSSAQSVFYEAQLPALANGLNFFNIYLLANGDLNASYIPASLSSKEGAILSYEGSIAAAVGQTLNIPLRINQTQRLAAITLGLSYNKQLLEINGLQGFDIFFIDQQKGEVRIAWMDQQGREYGAGQQLLSLQARLLEHIVPGTRYLELLPNTEFVNINAQILNNVPLATDYIVSGTTGLNEPQNLTHKVYPNPFNNSTLLQVNLPAEGRLRVSIHNYLGQEVLRLADGYFPQGQTQFDIHQHQLPASGAYVYTVDLLTPSGWQRSKGNLILIR